MNEPTQQAKMRHGVGQRLEFIEHQLYWEGGVNRSDLIDHFGVSMPQASNDITQYRDLAPGNLYYDPSGKRYLRSDRFEPILITPDASVYLAELTTRNLSLLDGGNAVSPALEVVVMPIPDRRMNAGILRNLMEAVRTRRSIHVLYHSMSDHNEDAIWRWITPHAFSSDHLRWHVRAYCHHNSRFKDFLLPRFFDVGELGEPGVCAEADRDWSETFIVKLIPNPKLPEGKRRTIARDYGMTNGELHMPVKCAMLYYFNRRLRLDVVGQPDEPHEAPLVIANKDEFDTARKSANGTPSTAGQHRSAK